MMEVWHRGKVRTFDDDDEAQAWIKEIEMAREQKRKPKVTVERKVEAVPIEESPPEVKLAVPDCCKGCEVTSEDGNAGDLLVSHPSRMGNVVTGSFQPGDDTAAWLETVHAQEST